MKKALTILVLLTAFMFKGEAFARKASNHRHAPHSQGGIAATPPSSTVKASHSPGCEKNRETRLRDCTTNCTPSGCKKNNELAKECSKLCEGHGNSVSDWLYKKCSLAMVGIESSSLSTENSNQLMQPSSSETMGKQDLDSHSSHDKPLSPAYGGHPQPKEKIGSSAKEATLAERNLETQSLTETP